MTVVNSMEKLKVKIRKNLTPLFLVVATFLNPLGFDVAFYSVMEMTNSYWTTTLIFYLGSALFFGLYFWFRSKDKKATKV